MERNNGERDLVVVSSAAQQAIAWRLATEEDPGDLLLRRNPAFQRRKPRTVTDYLDESYCGSTTPSCAPPAGPASC